MCPTLLPDLYANIFSGMPGGTTIVKMAEEVLNVTFKELSLQYRDMAAKTVEEFQLKCLESFGKTRNKVIFKNSLPKVSELEEKDTEAKRRIFRDTVHEAMHQVLINGSGDL